MPADLEWCAASVVVDGLARLGATGAPVGKKAEHGREVVAIGREGVGHARRSLLVRGRHDDPLALKPAEALRQDVRCDAG